MLQLEGDAKARQAGFPGLQLIFLDPKTDVSPPISAVCWNPLIVGRGRLRIKKQEHFLVQFVKEGTAR